VTQPGPCIPPLKESPTAPPISKLHLISTQWRSKESTNKTWVFVAWWRVYASSDDDELILSSRFVPVDAGSGTQPPPLASFVRERRGDVA